MSLIVTLAGCGDDGAVSSDEEARRAYLGLDESIEKALGLGMKGFNEATSANIPEQSTTGDVSGAMTVTGQVDQGVSQNKEMRLFVALEEYSDGPALRVENKDIDITYDTEPEALPALTLSLRNIPNGTFSGSLLGTFVMRGDLSGSVELDLTMSGQIEDDGEGGIRRTLGTTQVTGIATSGDGTYEVDVTL